MNIREITEAARAVIDILDEYHNAPNREMHIDPVLFAYLRSRHSSVQRQHYVYRYGSHKPQRIDFRSGGNNPVVLEFAVRPPTGGGTLSGSQNTSELRKLCRVSDTAARLRALLLVDLFHSPLEKSSLKETYDQINAGRGKFKRNSVRVIYVHADTQFNFLWSPFK